jgi:hypothetical protein
MILCVTILRKWCQIEIRASLRDTYLVMSRLTECEDPSESSDAALGGGGLRFVSAIEVHTDNVGRHVDAIGGRVLIFT